MSIYCRKETGSWMVAYTDLNGKRHDKSFGKGEEGYASAVAFDQEVKAVKLATKTTPEVSALEEVVSAEKQPIEKGAVCHVVEPECEKSKIASVVTFQQILDEYIEHTRSNGSRNAHLTSWRTVGNSIFIPYFGADADISTIDYGKHILPFINKIRNEPSKYGGVRSNVTINQYGHYLVTLFNYAILRGYISVSPMRLWKPLRVFRKERQITFEDACKIMEYAAPHLKFAIQLVCYLGVRPGPCELFSLTWDDVDFDNKKVHVYASKTNTCRYVDFTDDFAIELKNKKKRLTLATIW
ncbi:MAG: tyrosine-type recombinase/integrase [Desulfovibrio sp.]|nr:tyrosine-type recombinase/integrase [Desulfovibrio sp.]